MHFRDLLGMLLLRHNGISLLILPIAALSLSLTFRYFLPWYVIAVVIVISLVISESMTRSLTDLLLPGEERTWSLAHRSEQQANRRQKLSGFNPGLRGLQGFLDSHETRAHTKRCR